jgi:hypothetical protein
MPHSNPITCIVSKAIDSHPTAATPTKFLKRPKQATLSPLNVMRHDADVAAQRPRPVQQTIGNGVLQLIAIIPSPGRTTKANAIPAGRLPQRR